MNGKSRFKAVMDFQSVDRLPYIEWAPYWDQTIDRWYKEGLPGTLKEAWEIRENLGLDSYREIWISVITEQCPKPEHHGASIIKSESDYEAILAYLYPENAFNEKQISQLAKQHDKGDMVIWFTLEGFFWHPRTLFGIEPHMYAFYDNAKLMKRINEDLLRFHLKIIDELCKICVPDYMVLAEDMSYNNGPMLSKEAFDEFLAPYYRGLIPEIKKRGIIPMVDSDGDVHKLIPWLKEVGIEGILPLERMAGVDIVKLRKDHPKFKLIGAFDKTVMHLGEAAIRKEFDRIFPVMSQGGYIPSVDHQTPPEVSLDDYRLYVKILKEYCQKADCVGS